MSSGGFESIVEKLSRNDPVEMRKRLANICKATERVDARFHGAASRGTARSSA